MIKYITFILLLTSLFSCNLNERRFDNLYDKAMEKFDNEEYLSATVLFEKALSIKKDAYTYEYKAKSYYSLGLEELHPDTYFKYAITDFNSAIEMYNKLGWTSSSAECLIEISKIYYELEGLEKALEYLNKALQTDRQETAAEFDSWWYDDKIGISIEFTVSNKTE
jgi:tetratricopeptide (TPR) repeat protein